MAQINSYELTMLTLQEMRRTTLKMIIEESYRRMDHFHKWGRDTKCEACGVSQKEYFFSQRAARVCPGLKR